MTLFGGSEPMHDLLAEPDCMSPFVHADLLHGYADEEACEQTATAVGQMAWFCLFANFAVIVELRP